MHTIYSKSSAILKRLRGSAGSSKSASGLCAKCDGVIIPDQPDPWKHDAGTVLEVERAARVGCRFCTFLCIALDLCLQLDKNNLAWAQQTRVTLHKPVDATHILLQPQTRAARINVSNVRLVFGPTRSHGKRCSDQCLTTADFEIDNEILHPDTENEKRAEANDPASFQLAKDWIENCLHNHSKCSKNETVVLPTRLLRVGDRGGQAVKLWEPQQGTKGAYTALSYCWGTGATVTATPGELTRLLAGFSLSELPNTLQQAVQVTRELGFEYLWVDSLCILQGASGQALQDWVHESARMGQVYANAVVTISASASSSCEKGLFYPRACEMPFERKAKGNDRGQGLMTLSIDGYPREYQNEPVHKRAWAFQERLLSQRILSYCLQDMMWHCNEGMRWERNAPGYIHRTYKERLQNANFEWKVIVIAYMSRSMTKPGDKLPALSAVANVYHETTNDEYLAGLWRSELPKALLWQRTDLGVTYLPKVKPCEPSEYRAPTWSWASLDCNIWMLPSSQFVARILDCTVTPATADAYGMVAAAELVLECPFLRGDMSTDRGEFFFVGGMEKAVLWPDEDEFITRHDANTSKQAIAILIAKSPFYYGLVLRPSKSAPNCYIRIAMFCSSDEDTAGIWNLAEIGTFTII